jgi:hypothetical protein
MALCPACDGRFGGRGGGAGRSSPAGAWRGCPLLAALGRAPQGARAAPARAPAHGEAACSWRRSGGPHKARAAPRFGEARRPGGLWPDVEARPQAREKAPARAAPTRRGRGHGSPRPDAHAWRSARAQPPGGAWRG